MNKIANLNKKIVAILLAALTVFSIPAFAALSGKDAVSGVAITASAADASVNRTKLTATARALALVNRLDGKYFTTTCKAVKSSKTAACYNVNVIASSWLKDTMGMVPSKYSLMPEHYYSATGQITCNAWSCAGFANYALWYVYASKSTDNVKCVNVYTGSFTKADLDKAGLWPGDVIRIDNSHSVMYLSHSDSGLTVLDSNWNYDNRIQKHTISYSWHRGTRMACTRGANYVKPAPTPQPTPVNPYYTCDFRMKSAAYTNAYTDVNGSYVGRVYPNDLVRVKAVYNDGAWLKLECPWTGGTVKTVFVKTNEFKFKCTKYINAYNGVNGSYVGRAYPGDVCTVQTVQKSGSIFVRCVCPWTGNTNKTIYVKANEIY